MKSSSNQQINKFWRWTKFEKIVQFVCRRWTKNEKITQIFGFIEFLVDCSDHRTEAIDTTVEAFRAVFYLFYRIWIRMVRVYNFLHEMFVNKSIYWITAAAWCHRRRRRRFVFVIDQKSAQIRMYTRTNAGPNKQKKIILHAYWFALLLRLLIRQIRSCSNKFFFLRRCLRIKYNSIWDDVSVWLCEWI